MTGDCSFNCSIYSRTIPKNKKIENNKAQSESKPDWALLFRRLFSKLCQIHNNPF